jgi:nucleotide-binding universal stress UspA family protein
VVVGSHGQGRIRGIVLGSTATELVHKAPCSVLVARQADPAFPRRIVVGVDGSPESAVAYAVARHVSERFSAELEPIVAQGGEGVDEQLVAKIVDHHEDLPDERCRPSSQLPQTPISSSSAAAACAGLRRSARSASGSHTELTARHWLYASRIGSGRAKSKLVDRGGRAGWSRPSERSPSWLVAFENFQRR